FGGLFGVGLGKLMIRAYAPFFSFPRLEFLLQADVLVSGVLVALAAGLVATFGSVRRVVKLPPAVAMKPPAPATYRPMFLERIGVGRLLPPAARMVARRLQSNPFKSILSSVGIALSLGILIAVSGLMGALETVIDVVFRQEQR